MPRRPHVAAEKLTRSLDELGGNLSALHNRETRHLPPRMARELEAHLRSILAALTTTKFRIEDLRVALATDEHPAAPARTALVVSKALSAAARESSDLHRLVCDWSRSANEPLARSALHRLSHAAALTTDALSRYERAFRRAVSA